MAVRKQLHDNVAFPKNEESIMSDFDKILEFEYGNK